MIKINRRDWIAGAMASTALLCARSAAAQAYPQRAVRIIVPIMRRAAAPTCFSRLLAAANGAGIRSDARDRQPRWRRPSTIRHPGGGERTA